MATLKNTTINDTGFIKLPSGTTAQRPVSPTSGMTRFNTTENAQEYWNGSQWILDINPDGTTPARAATNATQLLSYQTTSGYYWIKPPQSSTAYYVYCDQSNNGGGWMLMMNILSTSDIHVTSNSATLTSINGNNSVEYNSSSAYRWSTATINEFLFQTGNKVMWIEQKRSGTVPTGWGWFIRPGTQSQPLWPTALECPNRDTIRGSSQTDYCAYGFSSATDARDDINRVGPGDYTGTGHFYPTIYSAGQCFFCATSGPSGIRIANPITSQSFSNNQAGYLWLKVY